MLTAPKNFHKKLLGRSGEVRARKFLKKHGYKILTLNYKTYIGEIDIVAQEKSSGAVVFVEVKTRLGENFGRPSEAVGYKKREKYFKIAEEYLVEYYGSTDVLCRFDVVEIENGQINHVINAFYA